MLVTLVNKKTKPVFEAMGMDVSGNLIIPSGRPDLSDFQCNVAMQLAKQLKKNPREIAEQVKTALESVKIFSSISIDGPGFINLRLADDYLISLLSEDLNIEKTATPKKIVIDYGGPNIAKPLHVGHLRSGIIGEAIKRISRKLGHEVVGDVHLGDWGTPMGMIIAQLEKEHPDWPYFKEDFDGSKNFEFPLTADELNDIYPAAAKCFKEDEIFAEKSRLATYKLQTLHKGYYALWKNFSALSIETVKKDFVALGLEFDYWLGESDSDKYIEEVKKIAYDKGLVYTSEGAKVIDVILPDEKKEIPPLIFQKTDGAATYATTDLATILQRIKDFKPDTILYVVDKRQAFYFSQIFNVAERMGMIKASSLEHAGFGTMNGKDGKPFKTRDGGVMRLGDLIQNSIELASKEAGFDFANIDESTLDMVTKIAIASIKFGDLSNLRTTDYIFNPEEFVKFEGKTGPYVQYAAVRAASILDKAGAPCDTAIKGVTTFNNKSERDLAFCLLGYSEAMDRAFEKRMPSEICDYVYELASKFNNFYHESHILSEEDQAIKNFRLMLASETMMILKDALSCLGIEVPDRMLRG